MQNTVDFAWGVDTAFMKQLFLLAFLILSITPFTTQANTNTVSCGIDSRQKILGALPELSKDSRLLFGFRCEDRKSVV